MRLFGRFTNTMILAILTTLQVQATPLQQTPGTQLRNNLNQVGGKCLRALAMLSGEIRDNLVKQTIQITSPNSQTKIFLALVGRDPSNPEGRIAYVMINSKDKDMHCELQRIPMIEVKTAGDEVIRFTQIQLTEARKIILSDSTRTFAMGENGLFTTADGGKSFQQVKIDKRSVELISALMAQ